MFIEKFVKNPIRNNNYLLIDEQSKEAVLIDCSEADDEIINYLSRNHLKLKYILLTHAHFDHVMGVEYFRKKLNVPVYLHKDDKELLNMLPMFVEGVKIPSVEFFDEEANFYLAGEKIEIIKTAGHSKGSVCFKIANHLFSGDTMFCGTYGRTDLPFSSNDDMVDSLKRLLELSDDVIVYPGHGKSTFIRDERSIYNF